MLLKEVAPFHEQPETVDEVYAKLKRMPEIKNLSRDGDWIKFSRKGNDFILKRRELFVVADGQEIRIRRLADTARKVDRAAIFVNQHGTHHLPAK